MNYHNCAAAFGVVVCRKERLDSDCLSFGERETR